MGRMDGSSPPPPTPDPASHQPDGGEAGSSSGLAATVRAELRRAGRLVDSEVHALEGVVVPAWRSITRGEPRWPVSLGILAAIAMQIALPDHLAPHPRWALPALEFLLLVGLVSANPRRIDRRSGPLRAASMVLIALISAANAWSAARLVLGLVRGTEHQSAPHLLTSGGAIWLTNVIAFCLWYWELDRGGPVARAFALRPHPDFLFPQMASPELAPAHWEPAFVDYLYLSFTNATAFSPTDVLPLSAWAKLTMMLQSGVSVATVALIIARAVNILQ